MRLTDICRIGVIRGEAGRRTAQAQTLRRGTLSVSAFANSNADRAKYVEILNQARLDWDALREVRRRAASTQTGSQDRATPP